MVEPARNPNDPYRDPDVRTGFTSTALFVVAAALIALIALFAFGNWNTTPNQNTALNDQNTTTQTIPQQGTEPVQPAQPEQQPAPAGNNTTQP